MRRTVALGTDVVSGPMSAHTARLAIGTALDLGKTLLALLKRQIAAFALGLSLAFALAFALAAEPLPRNHGHRIQLQGFCHCVVRLRVFARGAQKKRRGPSHGLRRLLARPARAKGCVGRFFDGFGLCQVGTASVTTSLAIGGR